ncbi:MAG: LysM peptidoglycan-binding domain-containing protein [Pyrinomonadaceae bacterium]|nr:LysM peptidoglycan-binding domain-containing protein [Pyrinomonadaceae bacterium]
MRNILNIKVLAGLFAVIFLAGSTESFAQRNLGTVESGTIIRVRMNQTLSSKEARVGDTFTTNVTEPVYSNTGAVVIPTGSTVVGKVNAVTKAKKGGDPGTIDVNFTEVRLPNGTSRVINGSLTNLDSKDAKSDNEGTASGDDRKNDKIIFIGGGAGGGAIIGGIIGGGKGALIGGILGALGGLAGERLTKGEEATVKAGTEFGVILNRSVTLPRFGAIDDDIPAGTGNGRTYIVQPGDTLGKISVRFYGTSRRYMDIYNANRDKLSSPSRVDVGQELRIP